MWKFKEFVAFLRNARKCWLYFATRVSLLPEWGYIKYFCKYYICLHSGRNEDIGRNVFPKINPLSGGKLQMGSSNIELRRKKVRPDNCFLIWASWPETKFTPWETGQMQQANNLLPPNLNLSRNGLEIYLGLIFSGLKPGVNDIKQIWYSFMTSLFFLEIL